MPINIWEESRTGSEVEAQKFPPRACNRSIEALLGTKKTQKLGFAESENYNVCGAQTNTSIQVLYLGIYYFLLDLGKPIRQVLENVNVKPCGDYSRAAAISDYVKGPWESRQDFIMAVIILLEFNKMFTFTFFAFISDKSDSFSHLFYKKKKKLVIVCTWCSAI